jgi:type I restriction-modification system DNA methylase subunit
MLDKEEAFKKIANLVDRFEDQKDFYHKAGYNETLTRRDFIDPFFKALGWDIDNENGYAESYREVMHEDRIRVGSATKAPDYSFRLMGGKRLFFVEAKKPSILIKDDITPAYQIRRYGWSAKLPISIITDFEEFAIYDCTKKPYPQDKASTARMKYLTYPNYLTEFDFVWNTFSKEKVLKGSFDKYVQSDSNKKGTATVDADFLESLDRWRVVLANSIWKNNPHLDEDEINLTVQKTIDRIIFLRIAEDRSIEPYGNLKTSVSQGNYYQNIFDLFRRADQKYNSGLFDFSKDTISKKLAVDDKVIKSVISELYYPECPYEFAVLPVEILGTAYEQFLGKQIRINSSNKIRIEAKPDVRKAGGVYYTPQYIVDYIVQNTIGSLIKGKTPKEIEEIKIVDPACGSGSFLLGAYQYFLDFYKDYYSSNGKQSKGGKNNALTPEGNLTTERKKDILIRHIHGVDIDTNAVEVTKLSLLLKCMEGETAASIATQMQLFNERVLPTLDNNIQSGNSLIEMDYRDGELDFGEERKVKPFNWKYSFPRVFKNGGFDAVVGNPPYIQLAMFEWFDEAQKKYMLKKYCSSMGRMNTFGFFIEKGISLLKQQGKLGFIVPNTVLTQEYYETLRKLILDTTHIDNIVSYDHLPFQDAVVETATIILGKSNSKSRTKISLCNKDHEYTDTLVSQDNFKTTYKHQFYTSYTSDDADLKSTIESNSNCLLNDLVEINQAIALKSNRKAHLFDKKKGANYKPVLDGREIARYEINWSGNYLKYDVNVIHSCKREDIFTSKEKIFFRRVSSSLMATIDTEQYYALNTLIAMNKKTTTQSSLRFILGLFNSNLMNYYYSKFLKSSKKVFSEIQARQIGQLPFIDINLKNRSEVERHNEIVKIVEQILKLKKVDNSTKINKAGSPDSRVSYLEDQLNAEVYTLYGLNKAQIKLVEIFSEKKP